MVQFMNSYHSMFASFSQSQYRGDGDVVCVIVEADFTKVGVYDGMV